MGYAGGFAFTGYSGVGTGPRASHHFRPRDRRNAYPIRDACDASGSAYGRTGARARARSFETFAAPYSGLIAQGDSDPPCSGSLSRL
jgi:hypothetical protein